MAQMVLSSLSRRNGEMSIYQEEQLIPGVCQMISGHSGYRIAHKGSENSMRAEPRLCARPCSSRTSMLSSPISHLLLPLSIHLSTS